MNNKPIGVFDSGVGGISVLRTIQNLLPNEKYILLADFKNAPYGEKSRQEILKLSKNMMEQLIKHSVKAVVVACNTATSAAVNELRELYDMPIIGLEPAIKIASQKISNGNVLVLATPATLSFMKFQKLYESYGNENIVLVECTGLAKLIEDKEPKSIEIKNYLDNILAKYRHYDISAVVIGCTHYSFIEDDIKKAVGCDVFFDGRYGTARHLKKVLTKNNLLADNKPDIKLISNHENIIFEAMLQKFMKLPLSSKE